MKIKELRAIGGGMYAGDLRCPSCDHVQPMGLGDDPRGEEDETWDAWAEKIPCENCGTGK